MKTDATTNRAPRQITRVVTLLALVAAILASLMAITPTADAQLATRVIELKAKGPCQPNGWEWQNAGTAHGSIDDERSPNTTARLDGGSGLYIFELRCNGVWVTEVRVGHIEVEVHIDPHFPFEPTIQFDPSLCLSCPNPIDFDYGTELPSFGTSPLPWSPFEDLAGEVGFADRIDLQRLSEFADQGLIRFATMAFPNEEGFGAMAYETGEQAG